MDSNESKKALAKKLGISRSSLYYKSKMKIRDGCLREEILSVLADNPSYGHRRIAIYLGYNRKRILRVMKKYGIKPYRRRARRPKKPGDLNKSSLDIVNWAKAVCPLCPNILWASDFTYFWFRGKFWYLATVLDIFSRKIVGFSFSDKHNKELILSALTDALKRNPIPKYLHSDQGSEYQAYGYLDLLKSLKIEASFSAKASPWQNGFQESFYSEFKKDLGDTSRFETIGEFIEALYLQINYYNNNRIHTALKMSPAKYSEQYSIYDCKVF